MVKKAQIEVHIGQHLRGVTSGRINEHLTPDFSKSDNGHNFVVFPGSGTPSGGDANIVAHMFDKWLPKDSDANIYGCYYPTDGGSLAEARADLNASLGEGIGEAGYQSRYTNFFDKTFAELICDNTGKLKSQTEIATNLRNTTLVGWCHGSSVSYELENYLIEKLRKGGLSETNIDKLMKNLSIVNFNPREPVHTSKATVLEVLPLSDKNLEKSFNNNIAYNKAKLARMLNESMSGFAVSDKFYVGDEIIGPTVFQNANRTLLMPTSVVSSNSTVTGVPTEHQAISELLAGRSKDSAEARNVVIDFLDKAMNPEKKLAVDTKYLRRNWEYKKGEFFLSEEASKLVALQREIEKLERNVEDWKARYVREDELMPYLSETERQQYKKLLEVEKLNDVDPDKTGKLSPVVDSLEFESKMNEKYRNMIQNQEAVSNMEKELSVKQKERARCVESLSRRHLKQVGKAALHLGGRVGAMYAAGHVGRKFQEWQDAKNYGGGIIALEAEQQSLAKQHADALLTYGGLSVMVGGIALGIGQAAGAKALQKGAGKVAAKSVPVIGTVLGVGYAARRAYEGDWTGAGLELTSASLDAISALGIATSATGIGAIAGVPLTAWATGTSFAIDAGLAARDGLRHADGLNVFGLTDEQGQPVMLTDENGERQAVGAAVNYKNNRKEGEAVWYDRTPDGQVKPVVQGSYKNDKKDGKWVLFDAEGHVREVAHYKDGVQVGEYLRLDERGDLIAQGNLTNGDYEEYCVDEQGHSTGVVRKSGQFKDGKQVGRWYVLTDNLKEFTVDMADKSVTTVGSDGQEYVVQSNGEISRWNSETNEMETGTLNENKEIVWQTRTDLAESIEWNRAHGRPDVLYPTIGDPDYMPTMEQGNSYRNSIPMAVAPEIRFHEENSGVSLGDTAAAKDEATKPVVSEEKTKKKPHFEQYLPENLGERSEVVQEASSVKTTAKSAREAASKQGFFGHRKGGIDDVVAEHANGGRGQKAEEANQTEDVKEKQGAPSPTRQTQKERT